jgi:hypothetical protein
MNVALIKDADRKAGIMTRIPAGLSFVAKNENSGSLQYFLTPFGPVLEVLLVPQALFGEISMQTYFPRHFTPLVQVSS